MFCGLPADPFSDFLKERLFGLSNPQGNHGESIKECHFHLDNTPTVCHAELIHGYQPLTFSAAFLHEVSLQVPPTQISV